MRLFKDLTVGSEVIPRASIYVDIRDRSMWPRGPWDDEPDKVNWVDEVTDLDCLIVRNHMGALCGYVGVVPGHPWYEFGYDDVAVAVHGGLTFAARCHESGDEGGSVCHRPRKGRPSDVWWFGFDCAHGWDRIPVLEQLDPPLFVEDAKYRDLAYVLTQVQLLAIQVRQAA